MDNTKNKSLIDITDLKDDLDAFVDYIEKEFKVLCISKLRKKEKGEKLTVAELGNLFSLATQYAVISYSENGREKKQKNEGLNLKSILKEIR